MLRGSSVMRKRGNLLFLHLLLWRLAWQPLLGSTQQVPDTATAAEVQELINARNLVHAPAHLTPNFLEQHIGWLKSFPLSQNISGLELAPDTILVGSQYRVIGRGLDAPVETLSNVTDSMLLALTSDSSKTQIVPRTSDAFPVRYKDSAVQESAVGSLPTGAHLELRGRLGPSPSGRECFVCPTCCQGAGGAEGQQPPGGQNQTTFAQYASVDYHMEVFGDNNTTLLLTASTSVLYGYLSVLLFTHGVQAHPMAVNISVSVAVLPILQRFGYTTYFVAATVLQVQGIGFYPADIRVQNMVLVALNNIGISIPSFVFNRIQSAWADGMGDPDEEVTMRMAILTYTSDLFTGFPQSAADKLVSSLADMAWREGAYISVQLLSSYHLGTQAEELLGDPKFQRHMADPSTNPQTTNQRGDQDGASDSGGSGIEKILVTIGCIFGGLAVLAAGLIWASRFVMLRTPAALEGNSRNGPAESNDNNNKSSPSLEATTSFANDWMADHSRVRPSEVWSISPSELVICKRLDGQNWLLGEGSFGKVYRGWKGVQDVAIKVSNQAHGPVHLAVFEKELVLLRHLNLDRNLVQFYGACISGSSLMLVMEFMEGGDLHEALRNDQRGKFGWWGLGGSILLDITRGLHFLHSNQVAHRDLKTKNILLTVDGEAKIGDVGLAKLLGSHGSFTQLDTTGTFAYAAPELLLDSEVDEKCDIYSFGVLCWEVCTHEVPRRGRLREVDVPVESPEESTQERSAALQVAVLIDWCLKRNPKERPTAKRIFEVLLASLSRPLDFGAGNMSAKP